MSHALQINHLEQKGTHMVKYEYNYNDFIHETMQCSCVEQCKVIIAENKVVIDELNARLSHAEEELQTSNKRMDVSSLNALSFILYISIVQS